MSLPFDGFKAAQTGLVDMGNISFCNTGATPIFNPFELAQYSTGFSEIVLNVTWAQLQASQNSLDTSFIDSAIQQVNQFNSTYHTDLGIKLRVWGGFTAPNWVKEIGGAPITVTGQNSVDPGSYAPRRSAASGPPTASTPGRASRARSPPSTTTWRSSAACRRRPGPLQRRTLRA